MNGKKNRVRHYSRASGKGKCKQDIRCLINRQFEEENTYPGATLNDMDITALKRRIINFKEKKTDNIKFINKNKLIKSINNCEELYLKYCKPNDIYTSKNIIQITQSDFHMGTYRIRQPGYYMLMSDITFDPIELFPKLGNTMYPNGIGKEGFGQYSLGFFAAITIECEDVILDLNNKTIKQSKKHYLQQRFFSIIELAESPFIHKQGPAKFTDKPIKSAKRCMIMNGTLGLSSHHGIHGNTNQDIVLCNLNIKDFEVAGIALNGSENSVLMDIAIGPIKSPPVISTFSQSIFAAKEIRSLISKGCKETFLGQTLNDILDNLQDAITKTENAILYNKGKPYDLFISENIKHGYDGNAYGLVLHVNGVAINELSVKRKETATGNTNIFLSNITIENINTAAKEIVALSKDPHIDVSLEAYGKQSQSGIFGAVLPIAQILNSDSTYKPNILSDALCIIEKCKKFNKITKPVLDWIEGKVDFHDIVKKDENEEGGLYFRLGGDSMAHVMKGTMGIFFSCGQGIFGENIKIYNVSNFVIETDKDELSKIALVVEANERPRATMAYDIVQTTCSQIDIQNVIISNNPKFPKKTNLLSIDKDYIKRVHTPHIHKTNETVFNLKENTSPTIKNKVINFNSNDNENDTNTDSSIEYIVV
jgi:hypothetical protein